MINIERLWEVLFSVIISVVVGAAKVFSTKKKRPELMWILGQLFVSGAAGLLMTLFARGALGLSGDLLGVAAGVAGWGGSFAIDAIYKKTMSKHGLIDDKKSDSDNSEKGG